MEFLYIFKEYLIHWYRITKLHQLVSLFSGPAVKITQNIRLCSKRAIDILNSPGIRKNVSIFIALSYVVVIIGGPVELVLGSIVGILAAFVMIKWQNGNTISLLSFFYIISI